MKKIIMLLAVAVLMFAFSGQAMAAFATGDLIEVLYQTGGVGNEYAVDLGAISRTTDTGNQVFTNNVSSVLGLGSLSGYSVAYFSQPALGYPLYLSGAATQVVNPGTIKVGMLNATQAIAPTYAALATNVTSGAFTYATLAQSNADSYWTQADLSGSSTGTMTGSVTTGTIEAKIGTSYIDQVLYYYPSAPAGRGSLTQTVVAVDLRTYADGHTELDPITATPVPPSILLMGSSLLGLLGIRRKMAV